MPVVTNTTTRQIMCGVNEAGKPQPLQATDGGLAMNQGASAYKSALNASVNGRGIKIHKMATAGNLLHTVLPGTLKWDELYLFACNTSNAGVDLTVEFGGVNVPDDNILQTLPAKSGLVQIVSGLVLQNGVLVGAFASVADVVSVFGYVLRK